MINLGEWQELTVVKKVDFGLSGLGIRERSVSSI